MTELRCRRCKTLLAEVNALGVVVIVCRKTRCKMRNTFYSGEMAPQGMLSRTGELVADLMATP